MPCTFNCNQGRNCTCSGPSGDVAYAPLFPRAPLFICTTLNRLREARACAEGFAAFRRHLKQVAPFVGGDDPVPLTIACDSNRAADVIWAIDHALCGDETRAWRDRFMREMACDFAERVLPIFEKRRPGDDRPRRAIEVARRFARGEATDDERRQARAAAYAAYAAAYAAYAAAYAAAADADAAAYAYAAADAAAYAYAAADAADAAAYAAAAYAYAYAAADAAAYAYAAAERQWQKDHLKAALLKLTDAPPLIDNGADQVEGGRPANAASEAAARPDAPQERAA